MNPDKLLQLPGILPSGGSNCSFSAGLLVVQNLGTLVRILMLENFMVYTQSIFFLLPGQLVFIIQKYAYRDSVNTLLLGTFLGHIQALPLWAGESK